MKILLFNFPVVCANFFNCNSTDFEKQKATERVAKVVSLVMNCFI